VRVTSYDIDYLYIKSIVMKQDFQKSTKLILQHYLDVNILDSIISLHV